MNMKNMAAGIACVLLMTSLLMTYTGEIDGMGSRALPTLSNGGVTPLSGDPFQDNFTFYVTYRDTDGDAPGGRNIILVIDDDINHYLNTTVSTYSTGVNFSKTISGMESGEHEFHFYCWDYNWNTTVRYPSSGSLSFTVTGDHNTPTLGNITLDPYMPGVGQPTNISVIYKDAGDHAPKYVQISINSGTWKNMTIVGDDHENGVLCYYNFTPTTYGYYNFRVRTEDTTNLTYTTNTYGIYVQNAPPVLFDGGVTPSTGDADKTKFTFYINYKDWE
jgi:hypothetical protein